MEALFLEEAEYGEWEELVAGAPGGSPYADPRYLDVLCRTAGGSFRVLGVRHGQELVGGLAVYERRSRTGRFVAPRLLLYYLGPVVREYPTKYPYRQTSRELSILGAVAEGMEAEGYAGVELRARSPVSDVRPFLARGWSASPSYSYVESLGDLEAAWDRMEQNLRRLVERAEGEGLTVEEDDDFGSYYRMHLDLHERKGAPLYLPEPAFRAYFEGLREAGLARLFHARLSGGRSVAAQLVLASRHPVTHTVTASSDAEHHSTGASPLLRWRVFRRLAQEGYEANDLTDASLNPVTRFKAQLGATLERSLVLRGPERIARRAERALGRRYWELRDRIGKLLAGNG